MTKKKKKSTLNDRKWVSNANKTPHTCMVQTKERRRRKQELKIYKNKLNSNVGGLDGETSVTSVTTFISTGQD